MKLALVQLGKWDWALRMAIPQPTGLDIYMVERRFAHLIAQNHPTCMASTGIDMRRVGGRYEVDYLGPWTETEILEHAIAVGDGLGIEVDLI